MPCSALPPLILDWPEVSFAGYRVAPTSALDEMTHTVKKPKQTGARMASSKYVLRIPRTRSPLYPWRQLGKQHHPLPTFPSPGTHCESVSFSSSPATAMHTAYLTSHLVISRYQKFKRSIECLEEPCFQGVLADTTFKVLGFPSCRSSVGACLLRV